MTNQGAGKHESLSDANGTMSRRRLLGRTAAVGAAALAAEGIAARGAAASPLGRLVGAVTAFQDATPVTPTGQILKAASMSELTTLHPFMTRFTSAKAVGYHVNEGLTKFAPDFAILPGLATKWEVSDDQLTFTFALRQGVKWHDGQPFTAKDVKFTLDAAGAADSQSPALPVMKTYVKSVETPDDGTVVVTLNEPYSPFLATLAELLTILPSHLLDGKVYDDQFALKPVGTGPYKVTDRQTSFISLEANTDYWGDLPFTAKILLKDAPDVAAQQAGLLAGELDVVPYTPTTMKPLLQQGYKVFKGLAGSVHGLDLDMQNPILQDADVRQALALGLDRQRIKDVQYADGVFATSIVSPAYGPYHDDSIKQIERDVDGAKSLLDKAGWAAGSDGMREKDGQKFELKFQAWAAQQWQDIATITQASWKDIGVDVKIETVELARLTDVLSTKYDLAANGWPLTSDPIVGLTTLLHSTDKTIKDGGTYNVFHYNSPEVDKALADAYGTTDVEKRVQFCHQVQQQVAKDQPFLIIAHPTYEQMCTANITLDETGTGDLSSVGPGFFMNRWSVKS
jgi:peptide/nickel transport system substrate-binding protein